MSSVYGIYTHEGVQNTHAWLGDVRKLKLYIVWFPDNEGPGCIKGKQIRLYQQGGALCTMPKKGM